MNTILDTKPYMLYETVGMLVKYVNRISMLEIRDAMLRLYRNYVDETWHRRLECLQDIVQEVCKDVNREATEMQYFFGRREPGPGRDATTMARVMTIPFQAWRDHTLAGEALLGCPGVRVTQVEYHSGTGLWQVWVETPLGAGQVAVPGKEETDG